MFFPSKKILSEVAGLTEFDLAKYKAVLAEFPDAKISGSRTYELFTSKGVNSKYTNYTFSEEYNAVYVVPYSQVAFNHGGVDYTINVHSSPRKNRLVYKSWGGKGGASEINFSRIGINFKNNNFKLDMLTSCKIEIMKFIQANHNCTINTKNLDPKLKKMLILI